jgi:hypothetical protein
MKRRTTPEKIEIPPATEPSTAGPIDTATIELLAKWRVEDATDDPEEVRLAEQELAQFKQSMNQKPESIR